MLNDPGINVLKHASAFEKNAQRISPAVIHFNAEARESAVHIRERLRLRYASDWFQAVAVPLVVALEVARMRSARLCYRVIRRLKRTDWLRV